jgi:succinate dehydrogenase / fumarate reductase iron-sulfur subunit
MGGVRVEADSAVTTVKGLFAAGEVAAGLHGANRLGGNSLSDLVVFGRRAGLYAAEYARSVTSPPDVNPEEVDFAARRLLRPFENGGGENPYAIHSDLQDCMQNYVGIIRTESELVKALDVIAGLRERLAKVTVEGNRQYNPGWHLALDLHSMLSEYRDPAPQRRPGPEPGAAGRGAGRAQRAVRGEKVMASVAEAPAAAGAAPAAGTTRTVTMRVWRGDASGGAHQEFSVPMEEGMVVLDVIHRIQATQAHDLAVRWNCKAGKCGSCSAEINGQPRLMCMTRMNIFEPGEVITVSPIKTFPLIKDLVSDVSFNYEVAKRIPPLQLKPKEPDGTRRMNQEDVDRVQEFHKCIECFLCQNVCHVIRDHEDNKRNFAGPRFLIRLAALEMHPLDIGDRSEFLRSSAGIGYCNITKCCTDVCPEHIHITDNAIIPLKERVVTAFYDPVAWLRRKMAGGQR